MTPTVITFAPLSAGSEFCEGSQGDSSVVRLPQNDKEVCAGKILVFVNLGYSKLDTEIASAANGDSSASPQNDEVGLWNIDQTTGKVTAGFTAGLDLKGNSLENVSKILSANGTWQIDENGKLTVKEIEAENGRFTKELGVGTPENPQGITLFDPSGNPYCVKVETGGAVVSTSGECGKQ